VYDTGKKDLNNAISAYDKALKDEMHEFVREITIHLEKRTLSLLIWLTIQLQIPRKEGNCGSFEHGWSPTAKINV
jgi:hypothetical protein